MTSAVIQGWRLNAAAASRPGIKCENLQDAIQILSFQVVLTLKFKYFVFENLLFISINI